MAVAAYASLVSLVQVIDRVQQLNSQGKIVLDEHQVQSFLAKTQSLLRFLEETNPLKSGSEIDVLISKIPPIAVEAEFIIDNEVVDQLNLLYNDELIASSLDQALHPVSRFRDKLPKLIQQFKESVKTHGGNSSAGDGTLLSFRTALDVVVQKIDSINEELNKSNFGCGRRTTNYTSDPSPVEFIEQAGKPSAPLPTNSVVVGFENRMRWVIDKLTDNERSFQVIPIVGMGGIGKTTLAQSIYRHPSIQRRFDTQMSCTISQIYNVKSILESFLGEEIFGDISDLGQRLYQKLYGRRYLIVMDDMWEVNAWETLKLYLPDNRNGSRVIVTTRNTSVGNSCGESSCALSLLDHNTSWDLLRQNVFGEGCSCPDELNEIGKRIAEGCGGLPLSLATISGILSKSDMTPDYWNYVARNVKGIVSSTEDEHCLKVLSLSYHFLPIHLKPCFLYLRMFREDQKIEAKFLIRKWIVEGFVTGKATEDVAYGYLNDLVDRNLVLIHGRNYGDRIKLCGVHDLVRELCIREASEVKFLSTPNNTFLSRGGCQLMCSHMKQPKDEKLKSIHLRAMESSKTTKFRVCDECRSKYPFIDRLRLVDFFGRKFPTTLRSIEARALEDLTKVPIPMIRFFWNLQYFRYSRFDKRVDMYGAFLAVIWEMTQIRYLDIYGIRLPEPVTGSSSTILSECTELHALDLGLSNGLIDRLPNLRRLKIRKYVFGHLPPSEYSLHLLQRFPHLESFTFVGDDTDLMKLNIEFPRSLKKLSLRSVEICWDDTVEMIGSLPDLEVLKLVHLSDPNGNEWKMKEGGFRSLRALVLRFNELRTWTAESEHMPALERLEIKNQKDFEIPPGVGDIDTLHSIRIYNCCDRTLESARRVVEQQDRYGNEILRVYADDRLVQVC